MLKNLKWVLIAALLTGMACALAAPSCVRAARGFHRAYVAPPVIDEELQVRVAYHEAGHAVMIHLLRPKTQVSNIEVNTRLPPDGLYGVVHLEPRHGLRTADDIRDEAVTDLAGRAAEKEILGAPTNGATVDLMNANGRFWRMCLLNGLCNSLMIQSRGESYETTKTVERCLNESMARAERLTGANHQVIVELAALVLSQPVRGDKHALTGDEFRKFMETQKLKREADLPPLKRTCP